AGKVETDLQLPVHRLVGAELSRSRISRQLITNFNRLFELQLARALQDPLPAPERFVNQVDVPVFPAPGGLHPLLDTAQCEGPLVDLGYSAGGLPAEDDRCR